MAVTVAAPVAYNMNGTFPLHSLVEHPTFGVGSVVELLPPDKMDVLFRDGMKRLRCVC